MNELIQNKPNTYIALIGNQINQVETFTDRDCLEIALIIQRFIIRIQQSNKWIN